MANGPLQFALSSRESASQPAENNPAMDLINRIQVNDEEGRQRVLAFAARKYASAIERNREDHDALYNWALILTSVDMQEPHVDRSTLPMLHPARQNGAKWFHHHPQVSTAVRKVIQSCFRGPWFSWRKVPGRYKITWFALFKQRFNWDPVIGQQVANEFKKFAAYRLKAMVSLAKKQGEKPDWISVADWAVMQTHWATPKAKANSEKARASRMSDRKGLGPHSHRAGSRSFVRVQDILEANNEDFSFIAVMKKTHQKADGTYVDQHARLVAEAYEKNVQERLVQLEDAGEENVTAETLDQREKNEIYMKAAIGVSEKGNVFGLGALGSKVVLDVGGSSNAVPVEESEMLTQKLQEMEAELKQSREENMDFQKRLEAMEKIVETLGSQIV